MARLDAAARFTPALTKLATDAACEPATTLDEQIVQPAVRDRENTADEARSRFSMISDKSVFSHRKCRSMALHTKRSVQCLTPKSMSGTAFWQETSVEKRLPDQKLYKCWNLTGVCQVRGIRLVLACKLFQASSSKTSNWPLLLPDQRKPRPNSCRGAPICCSSNADFGRFRQQSAVGCQGKAWITEPRRRRPCRSFGLVDDGS